MPPSPDGGEVVIVGGGAVGVNAALFLDRLGFAVQLVESSPDILGGAPLLSFINHGDGFEYHKAHHRRTGEYCIDGSMVKGLLYPLRAFRTRACDDLHPIRFFVANASLGQNGLSLDSFYRNAERMRLHFRRQFRSVRTAMRWSEEQAEACFLRRPETFARRLRPEELQDVPHVAGGYAGSSFGINMPHYYAYLKAALRGSGVECRLGCRTGAIEKSGSGYRVFTEGGELRAAHVLLASGHNVPLLAASVRGAACAPPHAGVYYLNAMTFLRLPATDDPDVLRAARRINFTLQQEHGAMLACVVPPGPAEDGLAVTYYPSGAGSQLRVHRFDPRSPAPPPPDWERLIAEGLPHDDPHVRATIAQACHLYPFLKGYAQVVKTECRPVFNAATRASRHGHDRRVREIPASASVVTDDGRISTWTSPKWTNAELVALMAANYVCSRTGKPGLPQGGATSFGPAGLDVASIAPQLNLSSLHMHADDALGYARRQGVPDRIVDTSLPQFAAA